MHARPTLIAVSLSLLLLSIITSSESHAQSTEIMKKTVYGCGEYGYMIVHCDPMLNSFDGYEIRDSDAQSIYTVTDDKPVFVDGKYDKALEMNASYKESVKIPNTPGINPSQFTVSFWVKGISQAIPRYGHIVSHTNALLSSGWLFDSGNWSSVRFGVANSSGVLFFPPEISIRGDAFTHVVGVFNGSALLLYKDGSLAGSTAFTGKYNPDPGVPLRFGMGAYCSCNTWTGVIDDIRLYNRTLSDSEIKQIYANSDIKGGLAGHWALDGNFNDSSGNNDNGILSTSIGSMVFAPDGRLFFDELDTGNIRIMQNDTVLAKPFATIHDLAVNWEEGMLGITLDPKFEQNHYLYLYYTARDSITGESFNRVVRFTDTNNSGTDMVVLLDRIPASKIGIHSGGALAFGPDDKLYVTVGDAYQRDSAQDPSSLTGKVLRINRDGSIPSDNPFASSKMPQSAAPAQNIVNFFKSLYCDLVRCPSPVYNIGHRNMYGIAFDDSGFGIVAEPGDNHYDEINTIDKGANYGWPNLQPPDRPPELSNNSSIKPLRSYWEDITPTQAIYYSGDRIPELKDRYLFGTYTGSIYALQVDDVAREVTGEDKIFLNPYPQVPVVVPVIGLAQSPDGSLYYGAYDIYKLSSLDMNTKRQILFPVSVNASSVLKVENVQLNSSGKELVMDLSPNERNITYSLDIKIPRGLLDGITNVTIANAPPQTNNSSQQNAKIVDLKVDRLTQYTAVHLHTSIATKSTLVISGKEVG